MRWCIQGFMRWRITFSRWRWANKRVEPTIGRTPPGMNSRSHQNRIERVLILGHSGFIGGHLVRWFREHSPGVKILGEALPNIDLIRGEDADKLAPLFDAGTAVIMCAAIKRQLGDNLDTFSRNVTMAVNLCRLLEKRPVARLVFFSSAAVYGEEIEGVAITTATAGQSKS